jgi:hypothetical protein
MQIRLLMRPWKQETANVWLGFDTLLNSHQLPDHHNKASARAVQ